MMHQTLKTRQALLNCCLAMKKNSFERIIRRNHVLLPPVQHIFPTNT
uniref:Uncharacterized protein n=1 Tax=Arundo donax TaxID=35708 RepID=A0A0A9FXH3_ARUDO